MGSLVPYLVNHLREKRFRVRPHVKVLQLKLDSHSRHVYFFICKEPRQGSDRTSQERNGTGPTPPGWAKGHRQAGTSISLAFVWVDLGVLA